MNTQQYLDSHASLMASLLEHAGHLSEAVRNDTNKSIFPKCVRYVVYTFFTGNSNDSYIRDIEKSAILHQKYLTQNTHMKDIIIKRPNWIKPLYASPSCKTKYLKSITDIEDDWEHWNPPESIGQIMKRSIDTML